MAANELEEKPTVVRYTISKDGKKSKEEVEQYEGQFDTEEWQRWFDKPWPKMDSVNDDNLCDLIWTVCLQFRDMTQEGAKHGYYMASRNKVVAEAREAFTALIESEKVKAVEPFRQAMVNKGSHPEYHDQQVAYLKQHWPTLYNLLKELESKEEA